MDKYQEALLKTSRAYIGFSIKEHMRNNGI